MHLYAVGGKQRELRPVSAGEDWYEYQAGLVLDVDLAARSMAPTVEYVSPPEVCPPDGATILFKSGSIRGDQLFVCTQTEVIIYRLPMFQQIGYVSLPLFNDLHHVVPTPNGTMLVANTGLDMVVEVTPQGDLLRQWDVLGGDPWARFSREIDYRLVKTTKPHLAHPNYVFLVGEDIWATRFEQRDAVCLTRPGHVINIGIQRVHDGVVYDGRVYFTTVDGHVVVADPERCEVSEIIDLNEMSPDDVRLGWCRGIYVDRDQLYVGFSRIRPTRFRENVGWALRGFKRDMSTHIGCYDLRLRKRVGEVVVEPHGLNAIFALLPVDAGSSTGASTAVASGTARLDD